MARRVEQVTSRPAQKRRGFLLLIVVGLLAVMLTLVVGFVSYTRTETVAVATVRDKVDGMMLMHSALDFTIANMNSDLFDNGGQPRAGAAQGSDNNPKGIVSSVLDPNDPCYKKWYRPWEPGYTLQWWLNGEIFPPFTAANFQARWTDIPATYFPSGGVHGRWAVQVLDANAFININNWNEDCNPTQCQMSHMIMESLGDTWLENYYGWRDNSQWGGGSFNSAPLRYDNAWRVATQTRRSTVWPNNTGLAQVTDGMSPNWVTHNSTWTTLQGVDLQCIRAEPSAKGLLMQSQQVYQTLGPGNYYPPTHREGFKSGMFSWGWDYWGNIWNVAPDYFGSWNLYGDFLVGQLPSTICYSLHSNVDPDTGRSPINVNTCFRSGEIVPNNTQFVMPRAYTMESVFNVESLRRIIKIGDFFYKNGAGNVVPCNASDSTSPNFVGNLSAAEKQLAWSKHEQLRMKLAYQYQETLCRYFTASYSHPNIILQNGAPLARQYPPLNPNQANYAAVYPSITGVSHFCPSNNYAQTRFPVGVRTFRKNCADDFTAMSASMPVVVTVDNADGFNVPQGQLDKRMANAVYDNIVPGKALIYASTYKAGDPASNDNLDPLQELFDLQLGRDETADDPYNTHANYKDNANGYFTDNPALFDSGLTAVTGIPAQANPPGNRITLRCKGQDIAPVTAPDGFYSKQYLDANGTPKDIAQVPWRQLCFGPDWFSTELTTTSTCFYVIITVQIQDNATNNDVYVGQWGAVVELAPDIVTETSNSYNSAYATGNTPQWPKGDPNDPAGTMGLGYFRGGWPTLIKAAKQGDAYANTYSMDAFPDGTIKAYRSESASQGTQWTTTSTPNWGDWRGTTTNPQMSNDPLHCSNFYRDANPADSARSQTKKQVRIKAIWSLNGGSY
jgi:hypothetical protein